jgi:hypothetical protein
VNVKRLAEHETEDLIQTFVADKVIEKHLLKHADERRGKFRTFFLTSFKNYCTDRHRMRAKDPHIFGGLSDGQSVGADPPDMLLESEWARAMVRNVLEAMRQECIEMGRTDMWEVFHARTVQPLYAGIEPPPYELLAQQLGLGSPTQAANLLVTGKRMYARLLRLAVAEYELNEEDIEAEVAQLQRSLQFRMHHEALLR